MIDTCIRKVPIFKSLTEHEISVLQQSIQSRKYEKGEFIFREGERSDILYILHHGLVKISKYSRTGKEQIIRFLFPEDFFGQFSVLQRKTHYANAEVLDSASVCLIYGADFMRIMENNPAMSYQFLLAISDLLHQADERMSTISLCEVEERLARTLLLFLDKGTSPGENVFKLPIAKKELASLIGTTPETLSRKLANFESLNLVSLKSDNRICIMNRDKLMEIANVERIGDVSTGNELLIESGSL
jgi:CRP-like cAMP-binding protein